MNQPMPPRESGQVSEIIGSFDSCDAGGISGWLASSITPGRRLTLEVLADGQAVARAIADGFRADLLNAGIDDGRHSFKVGLPTLLFDGNEHIIEVREAETGF